MDRVTTEHKRSGAGRREILEAVRQRVHGFRGRCFAETDLMISRRGCLGSSGFFADFNAKAMSFLTAGCSRTFRSLRTMCRARVPLPFNTLSGSGSFAPCSSKRLTQRGKTAIEKMASDAFSLGPKPMAKAL